MTKLAAICALTAMLLIGGCMPSYGYMVTACGTRDNVRYECATLLVRPVPPTEPMEPAVVWSCVRPGSGMKAAGWLKEW